MFSAFCAVIFMPLPGSAAGGVMFVPLCVCLSMCPERY